MKVVGLDEAGATLLKAAMTQLGLSARVCHRALTCAGGPGAGKLARTIADLAEAEPIQAVHLAEAV